MTENASGNLPLGDVDRLADQVMDLTDTPGSVDLVLGSPTRRHRPWGPPVIRVRRALTGRCRPRAVAAPAHVGTSDTLAGC